ncbi:TonB-dependent receptor domain-containing protein [Agaribacterium haliotis]|uniref:TonB-dependent receptor domain-containing protein n=1 Tax=Agaribacterium haliotis TaxID=2013869 RepID=UPI000BB55057|nr:TonB-dependent receptor [Agaribacterium haliotis]
MSKSLALKALAPLSAAISASIYAAPALANEDSEVEQVVVVGRLTNTEVSPEELEKQQAADLSDVFRYIPSVSVGGSIGVAQKIYVRGMEDTYLNVTVDGAPQTGTLFHHIGRVNIEPELLQQVEVQAGAGEATSGAGAIGGAIRFRTKSASDLLADKNYGGTVKASYFDNNSAKKGVVSGYGRIGDSWGVLASYVSVDSDVMVDGDGDDIVGTGAEQKLGFVKADGALGESQHLSVSYENRDESGEFPRRPNWAGADPEQQDYFQTEVARETTVANYKLNPNELINLEGTLYYTEQSLDQDTGPNNWGLYTAEVQSIGTDIRNTSNFAGHSLIYGVDYRQDKVTAYGDGSIYPVNKVSEEGTVLGVYIQDHWRFADVFLLSAGLRYDNYALEKGFDQEELAGFETEPETSSDGLSPNIGLSYEASEYVTMNIGYAEAMRGKEVGDGFTLESTYIEKDLQPEKVNNTEFGIEYADESLFLSAAFYQSKITDVIMDRIGRPALYQNIGEFKTKGLELGAAYQWNALRLSLNYSKEEPELNGRDVEGYEEIGLANARGDTWNFAASYIFSDAFELEYNYTAVNGLDVNTLYWAKELGWVDQTYVLEKPGYEVHDVFLRWKPMKNDTLSVDLAVLNAFNELYRDHSSVGDYSAVPDWEIVSGAYEPGRDVRATLTYNF